MRLPNLTLATILLLCLCGAALAGPTSTPPAEVAAFRQLSAAQRAELVQLSQRQDLVVPAAGGRAGLAINVRAARAAGFSPAVVAYLSAWYAAHPEASAAPRALPRAATHAKSVPSLVAKKAIQLLVKNWSRLYTALARVVGPSVAAKYLSFPRVQQALQAALNASDSIDAALTSAFAYLLPWYLQWAVQPIVYAIRLFLI